METRPREALNIIFKEREGAMYKKAICCAFVLVLLSGCATDRGRTRLEGTAVGTGAGAAAGALIGALFFGRDGAALGAAIGGAIGATAGYAYGNHVANRKEKYKLI
jgi:hypothetical protein